MAIVYKVRIKQQDLRDNAEKALTKVILNEPVERQELVDACAFCIKELRMMEAFSNLSLPYFKKYMDEEK